MGRRREGPRVDSATIAGVVAPVGWRRAGSSSPHLRAFAIGLARRPSAQRRVLARFVVEAGINLRKFLWDNDLATRYGLRVSHGVSEGRKSRYPPGLRLDLVVTSPLSSPTASCSHPSDVLPLAYIGASPPLCEVGLPPGGGDRRGALSVLTGGRNERAASDGDRSGHDWAM